MQDNAEILTMTETRPGRYEHRRARESLTDRVARLCETLSLAELGALTERWAARSLRTGGLRLGDKGRGLAIAISLAGWAAQSQRQRGGVAIGSALTSGLMDHGVPDSRNETAARIRALRASAVDPADIARRARAESYLALLAAREHAARQGV